MPFHMKLWGKHISFSCFFLSIPSNPNLSKFIVIQPAPLKNVNSNKVTSWKVIRKLRSFLLKKHQDKFCGVFWSGSVKLILSLYLTFPLFFNVPPRMIAPTFIQNFQIWPFLMAKDNHERSAFRIFPER